MNVRDVVGPQTLERARRTKWWLFARALDEILYEGNVQPYESDFGKGTIKTLAPESAKTDDANARVFWVRVMKYLGDSTEGHQNVPGVEGKYVRVERILRELMHECERAAVREVSP